MYIYLYCKNYCWFYKSLFPRFLVTMETPQTTQLNSTQFYLQITYEYMKCAHKRQNINKRNTYNYQKQANIK